MISSYTTINIFFNTLVKENNSHSNNDVLIKDIIDFPLPQKIINCSIGDIVNISQFAQKNNDNITSAFKLFSTIINSIENNVFVSTVEEALKYELIII